jgi:aerobic-type carbon monoxide dehydrogenase small subunit (CoxS/CutS family)
LELFVNGERRTLPDGLAEADPPLLWALRDLLGLAGTKFGWASSPAAPEHQVPQCG